MKILAVIIIPFLVVFVAPAFCSAQGTLTIAFDGLPSQPTNSGALIQSYSEASFSFTGLPGSDGFIRENNIGGTPLLPNDNSTYLQAGFGEGLEFSNGSVFGLTSVDLAEYSHLLTNFTVNFTGRESDGSTITTSFSGTGIDFQTFAFGPEWSSGLTEVEIPNAPWSMDNLAVIVPEPGSAELFALGAVVVSLWRSRRK